jgi:hypothetical protein
VLGFGLGALFAKLVAEGLLVGPPRKVGGPVNARTSRRGALQRLLTSRNAVGHTAAGRRSNVADRSAGVPPTAVGRTRVMNHNS